MCYNNDGWIVEPGNMVIPSPSARPTGGELLLKQQEARYFCQNLLYDRCCRSS